MLRFKNPLSGDVTWDDLVKGPITVSNDELDDLVLLRADGVPTYNFGVVVDDLDMAMTHVIRGDDHVNNTPRQINLYRALGADAAALRPRADDPGRRRPAPVEAPRRGERAAVPDEGYLPDAMVNYLARLGWSHGDEEVFSREQLVRVVRPRAREQVAGALGPGEAQVDERRVPEAPSGTRSSPRASRRPSPTSAEIPRVGHGPRRDDGRRAGEASAPGATTSASCMAMA